MHESLQLRTQPGAAPDFFEFHFPGQYHPGKAPAGQIFHPGRVMHRHLSAGVEHHFRRNRPADFRHSQILHNERVRAAFINFRHGLFQKGQFLLANHGVHRHVHPHAPGMAIIHGPFQAVAFEIIRAFAGIEGPRPQVHGVGAVLHRGDQRLPAPGRGKQFHHLSPASRFSA